MLSLNFTLLFKYSYFLTSGFISSSYLYSMPRKRDSTVDRVISVRRRARKKRRKTLRERSTVLNLMLVILELRDILVCIPAYTQTP